MDYENHEDHLVSEEVREEEIDENEEEYEEIEIEDKRNDSIHLDPEEEEKQ